MLQPCAVVTVAVALALDLLYVRGFEYEETELTSADYATLQQDNLGYSSAISGSFAIAGVYKDDELGTSAGAAYMFKQDEVTGEWSEHSRLTASDGSAGDSFGFSVSISGDIAIVGCQNHDFNSLANVGGAYIFTYDETSDSWSETAQLVGSTSVAGDKCGYSVSISSNSAIIGCYDKKAFIFEYDGSEWTETAALSGSGYFGLSVAIYDNIYAVVGDYGNDDATTNAGKAYVYANSVGSVWSLAQEVTASDAGSADNFGYSVSICQDWLFVGARYYDVTGASNAGAVYMFKNSDGTDGTDGTGSSWDETQIFTASDAYASAWVGTSVSINCDETNYYAVVGAREYGTSATTDGFGKAYVLNYDENENLWTETLGVQATDAASGDRFGISVATGGGSHGNCWISGAPFRNEFPTAYPNVGAIFIYCPAQTAQPTISPTEEIIETIAPTSSPAESCEYTETCKAWGDPHFNTWDGQVYHFQGTGYFDYVKNCDDEVAYLPFQISARHDTCRGTYSCVKEVYVSIDDGAGTALIWNGNNEATFASTGNNAVGTYSFDRNEGDMVEYVVSKSGFEINFVYDGQSAMLRFHYSKNWLKIETTDCLKDISNICGLCGTLNGDKSDEFTRCDNLNIVDTTDVATVLTGTPWENTHEFGESCCNAELDLLYLDESEQDCSVGAPEPEECDATCLAAAEIICEDVYELYCTDCDGVSATSEWIESCAFDLCADETCATDIVNDEYGVSQIVDNGCADEIVLDCMLEQYYQIAHLF